MAEGKLVMLVANRTATAERLQDAVRRRAEQGDVRFHLVVPARPSGLHRLVDPETAGREEAERQLETGIEVLSEAAGSEVTGEVGSADPVAAIADAFARHDVDEIIVSTLPKRMSKWLRVDLAGKARGFGVPVTHVEAEADVVAGAVPPPEPPEVVDGSGPLVRDAMNKIVVTVGLDDTLREAARRMTEHDVGAAVVFDEGSGLGVITERDLLRSCGRGEDPDKQRVGDHIAPHVIYAHEDWSLRTAAEKMTEGGFRHVIVLDPGGDPAAIISMRDIVRCWTGAASPEGAAA